MMSVSELLNGRSDPGFFIFNLKKQVIFANQIAWDLLNAARGPNSPPPRGVGGGFDLPPEITQTCAELKSRLTRFAYNSCTDAVYLRKIVSIEDHCFTIRGFILSDPKIRSSTQFLILLEKFAVRSMIVLEEARAHFHLFLKGV